MFENAIAPETTTATADPCIQRRRRIRTRSDKSVPPVVRLPVSTIIKSSGMGLKYMSAIKFWVVDFTFISPVEARATPHKSKVGNLKYKIANCIIIGAIQG